MSNSPNLNVGPSGGDVPQWLKEDIEELKEGQKESERRLIRLERFQAFVLGAAAAIGAVGGYLVAWLRGEK